MFCFSDSSFRTLPTDDEQTSYSLEEDRTFRRHRPLFNKENKSQSKATTSNLKMVKQHTTKAKPLQAANKSNPKSPRPGHVRVAHNDSESSNTSQNVRQESRSAVTSSLQNRSQIRGETVPEISNQPKSRRKTRMPMKNNGVLNDIKNLQRSTQSLIPFAPFGRLIREIMTQRSPEQLRITPLALQALRDSAESYIVSLFEDINRIALNRKQVTIQAKDLHLAMYIRGHK